ncbi:Sulfite reductase [NADPH] flavoprotein component, partial [Cryomyces minteri]
FPSAHPSFHEIVRIVSPMKRREYSIASSQKVTPNSVSLLVVTVDWVDPKGRDRFGQATRYLNGLHLGAPVTVSVKPSVMKLPQKSTAPLIMAGLGTGLAPFRAFVQERAWQKQQGIPIGSVLLYMGSRHQREEYLYGEEWEAYQDAGIITLLGRAFSRDQKQKIYIQDRMRETLADIRKAYLHEEGAFYLCGSTWPVPDVTNVLEEAIEVDAKAAGKKVDPRKEIDRLKDELRYVLEVY